MHTYTPGWGGFAAEWTRDLFSYNNMKELNRIGQISSRGGPVPIPSDWGRAAWCSAVATPWT